MLVTAGGTREPIDSVRFIGNRSSGRMGFALAAEAARRGAEVTVIAANVGARAAAGECGCCRSRPPPSSRDACERGVRRLRRAADGGRGRRLPARRARADASSRRIKGSPAIELEPTEDVLSGLAQRRAPGPGDRRLRRRARRRRGRYGRGKLERKGLDAVVVNDISKPGIGFDAGENEVDDPHRRRRRATRPANEQGAGRPSGARRGRAAARH